MAESDNPFTAMMDAWSKAQSDMMEALSKGAASGGTSQDPFAALRSQAAAFFAQVGTGSDGTAALFQKMFDPGTLWQTQAGQGASALAGLMTMPGLGDLADLEAKRLHVTKEWAAFQEAGREVSTVMARAWSAAFERFQAETALDGAFWSKTPDAIGDLWLSFLDGELIAAMKSAEFREAQARVINAGAAYKAREREIVEQWSEAHGVPTRSEVDALHEKLTNLERQISALRKQDG